MNCQEVYETGLLYHYYANTAYPLTPASFMQYRLTDTDEIRSFVEEEWRKADEICLYIHVPFCKTRCKFCEYVVLEGTTEHDEDEYVDLLLKEMKMYSEIIKDKPVVGYDLGGGTPAKLSVRNLKRITDAVNTLFNIKENVIFSIETTPLVAAKEPEKIKAIYDMGYKRISMGIQTVSEKLLNELGRDGSKSLYEQAVANIREAGFEHFNIDLMYGFLHQDENDFDNTLRYAIGLNPEYITLYRNRYKGTKLESEAGGVSIYKAMYQYRIAYRVLTENGYMGNIGKNTFSRLKGDYGTSDYLTSRVIYGTPYLGMGLGAQTFGMDYLSYNLGAANKQLEQYRNAINEGRLPLQDCYWLPKEETIAKMVSVAFYFAFIDLEAFKKRFNLDFCEYFKDEVKFVIDNQLMQIKDGRIYLTDRGADYINGVIPLFYSERSKKELKTVFANKKHSEEADEELFLSSYKYDNYEHPSVTTDIVAFTINNLEEENYRKNSKNKLSLLLIKRGEHPYMNHWALPGGFVKKDEIIEECALREIKEETKLEPSFIYPIGVFSDPGRDPRGWIISNAYTSIIRPENTKALSGDDAIDAKWFDVSFERLASSSGADNEGKYELILTNEKETLKAVLRMTDSKYGNKRFDIIENDGLAFDHAKIIATAIEILRDEIKDFRKLFGFLPEKFTLAEAQCVQEAILNTKLTAANFRRKVSPYVVETEEYTEGSGHRPAKIFVKKD